MIQYHFYLGEQAEASFQIDENGDTSVEDTSRRYPNWLSLQHNRCSVCTIEPGARRCCPAALALLPVVEALGDCISYEPIRVRVDIQPLELSGEMPAQNAVRSLVGLQLSLSSCPVLCRLRPMAQFHLPFAGREHSVFRFLGMYLIAQRIRSAEGLQPDWQMVGLTSLFDKIHLVNRHLAERLRTASAQDAPVNSLIILDSIAYAGSNLADSLKKLKPLFHMYL